MFVYFYNNGDPSYVIKLDITKPHPCIFSTIFSPPIFCQKYDSCLKLISKWLWVT